MGSACWAARGGGLIPDSRSHQPLGWRETGTGTPREASGVAAPRRRRYERRRMPPRAGTRFLGPWKMMDPQARSWPRREGFGADSPPIGRSAPPSLFDDILRCSGECRYGPSKIPAGAARVDRVPPRVCCRARPSSARTPMDTAAVHRIPRPGSGAFPPAIPTSLSYARTPRAKNDHASTARRACRILVEGCARATRDRV